MADPEHIERIQRGVRHWNRWRRAHPSTRPDLSRLRLGHGRTLVEADLSGIDLSGAVLRATALVRANLSRANLSQADMAGANLSGASLRGAILTRANLGGADLFQADLSGVDLRGANLTQVDMFRALFRKANLQGTRIRNAREAVFIEARMDAANLTGAQLQDADFTSAQLRRAVLRRANLVGATLVAANLAGADLRQAELIGANLSGAVLRKADLRGANLASSILNRTNLTDADLTGCHVYGMSAWDLRLQRTKQLDLSITPERDAVILVDSLEVAQFIYLVLNNARIKDVIETITSKAVLILGRFTPERKKVLDRIRDHLRRRDVLPIMFDFEKPASRNILETVSLLAHMSRFVLADLTDASYVKREVPRILRQLRVPVQPLLLHGSTEPVEISRMRARHSSLLPLIRYKSAAGLLRELDRLLQPLA